MGRTKLPPERLIRIMADPTRFSILQILKEERRCACQILPMVRKSQPTIAIHLAKLEDAGILESEREGKKVFYRIVDPRVREIFGALGLSAGRRWENGCSPQAKK